MPATEFKDFYSAIHGREPFPWQKRLAREVVEDGWTKTIAIPTGCGKTSTIDIAVYALAMQADRPALERTAPLRIFFVIDRRLVVDDVFRHAQAIAKKINDAPELKWV